MMSFIDGYFAVPKTEAGHIGLRYEAGWVGECVATMPRAAARLVSDGYIITKDPFIAAHFFTIADAACKAKFVELTKWSWRHEGKECVPFPDGVVPYVYQTIGIKELCRMKRCILADDMGLGKAVGIKQEIPTPDGFATAGEVSVGDEIFGSDGRPTRVSGVYPQGLRRCCRINFSDGTSAECDESHLWAVNSPVRKRRGNPNLIKSTLDLMGEALVDSAGNARFYIPMCGPVEYQQRDLPIDPYLLGVILGDGSISDSGSVSVTDSDPGVWAELDRISDLGKRRDQSGCRHQGILGLSGAMRELGLDGSRSESKFIPAEFLLSSVPQRVRLLNGLMDTDGYMAKDCRLVQFSSSSKMLANGVSELVWSLGGTVKVSSRIPTYEYLGEKRSGLLHYTLTISLPPEINPFGFCKHASRYSESPRKYGPTRAIVSIEEIEPMETVCFRVAADDHLFLMGRTYTVTHNTIQIIGLINIDPMIDSALIIVPPSLTLNWAREFAKFSTRRDLTVWQMKDWIEAGCPAKCIVIVSYSVLGDPELRKRTKTEEETEEIRVADETYQTMLAAAGDDKEKREACVEFIEQARKDINKKISARLKALKDKRKKRSDFIRQELKDFKWCLVACDESHMIKNDTSARCKAVYGLLMQAQPQARAVFATGTPITKNPMDAQIVLEMVDKKMWNWKKFTDAYCSFNKHGDVDLKNFKNLSVLNTRLRLTCMIRRLKDHVLKDLPPKVRRLIPLEIDESREIKKATLGLNEAEILQARLDFDTVSSGKPFFDEASRLAAQHKISATFDNLAKARQEIGLRKVPHVVDMVTDFLETTNEKVIVFAHHRAVVAEICAGLDKYGVVKIVGGMSTDEKQASCDQFQAEDGPRVIVLNYQAGGTGWTLTRASRVFCAEFDVTPAIMEQAEDRARRIGQLCTVFVDLLFAEGTIDSTLLGILNRKRKQARETLDGGKGNGEDLIPPDEFVTLLNQLAEIASGPYSQTILESFANYGSRPLTRNHLALLLSTIEGESR